MVFYLSRFLPILLMKLNMDILSIINLYFHIIPLTNSIIHQYLTDATERMNLQCLHVAGSYNLDVQ